MSEAELDLSKYWTEAELFALGETESRLELVDGMLHVSPSPKKPHQGISYYLMTFLEPAARRAGLSAYEASDVRLGTDRIVMLGTRGLGIIRQRVESALGDGEVTQSAP